MFLFGLDMQSSDEEDVTPTNDQTSYTTMATVQQELKHGVQKVSNTVKPVLHSVQSGVKSKVQSVHSGMKAGVQSVSNMLSAFRNRNAEQS